MLAIAVMLLTSIILLLSMAGGGIYPWSLQTAAVLLPAAALPILLQHDNTCKTADWRSPVWLLFLFLCIMILPLPLFFHGLSPIRAEANHIAAETIQELSNTNMINARISNLFTLTRNQAGSLRFLLLFIASFAAWNISRHASPQLRIRLLAALLLIGVIATTLGILGKWVFPQGDTLYWIIPIPHGLPGPMAGFINRNHYAGFLAILAPVALCATIHAMKCRHYVWSAVSMLITIFLSSGVLLSMSRGGTLACLTGLLTTTFIISLQLPWKQKVLAYALSILFVLGCGVIVHQVPMLHARLIQWRSPATIEAASMRFDVWRDSLQVAKAYPVIGAGPNAFRAVYPQHRLTSERATRDFAENEYVQWLAETGIIGTLLALAIAWIILQKIIKKDNKQDSFPSPWLPAAAGALAAAATHATVDFPFRLPIYTISLAALVALAWPAPLSNANMPVSGTHTMVVGIGLLLAILTLPANLSLDAPSMIASAPPAKILRALRAAPTYPLVWRRCSAILWQKHEPEQRHMAVDLLAQAAQYDPNNYILWQTLGQRRQALGDNAGANAAYRRVRELRDWVRVPELPESP